MTAFQTMILSGHGAPDIPPGGSLVNLLKSLINLFLAGVDIVTNEVIQTFQARPPSSSLG